MYRGGSKGKNLVGKRFGNLVVEKYLFTGNHGKIYQCRCDCGNIKSFRGSTLTSETIQACGCQIGKSNKGKTHTKQAKKCIGKKYHFLTIIGIEPNQCQRGYSMICKCDCGNLTKQRFADLKIGKVKSCGCYQREQASKWGSINGINNCSKNCNKHGWFIIENGVKKKARSGYEVIFSMVMNNQNISFQYEPKCFVLKKGMRYTPDFYLPKTNEWIETKGFLKPASVEKMNEFRKQGNNLRMIELKELEEMFGCCYITFIRRWDKGLYRI